MMQPSMPIVVEEKSEELKDTSISFINLEKKSIIVDTIKSESEKTMQEADKLLILQ